MPIIEIKLGAEEISTWKFWRAVLAEFLGTLLFLVCVTSVALGWGKNGVSANNVEVGIGIGLAIATLAQAFGHVSGGHLNPAVTFGMVFGGRTPIIRGFFYIVAQLVGGKDFLFDIIYIGGLWGSLITVTQITRGDRLLK